MFSSSWSLQPVRFSIFRSLEWTKQQIRNACYEGLPKFLLHDNDGKFGDHDRDFAEHGY